MFQDLVFDLRSLRLHPGFAVTAVLALAAGGCVATDVPLAGNTISIMRIEGQQVTPNQAPVPCHHSKHRSRA